MAVKLSLESQSVFYLHSLCIDSPNDTIDSPPILPEYAPGYKTFILEFRCLAQLNKTLPETPKSCEDFALYL